MMLPNGESPQEAEISDINVTPFIDVMLVLLVIFMATIPLATVNIPLDLPAINEEKAINDGKPLVISLDEQNQLYLGTDNIAMTALAAEVNARTQGNKETVIFFSIDKNVKYDEVMQLMNELRGAGYLKIGLVGLNKTE